MAKGDDLQQRLILFAARIIKVSNNLPKTPAGKHIAGQILRSGTAPAAHHGEARSAESTADFIHKMKIGVKELNETEVWLRIIIASDLFPAHKLNDLIDECVQLQRIFGASLKTAKSHSTHR